MVSFAAGIAAATARSTQGAVDEELARHWRTDYDLLVRHPQSVTDLERDRGIISSKFQGNLSDTAKMTSAQLEQIRNIPGVEIAAPLTMLGSVGFNWRRDIDLPYTDIEQLEPGMYYQIITVEDDNGFEMFTYRDSRFFLAGTLRNNPPMDFPYERYLGYSPSPEYPSSLNNSWGFILELAGFHSLPVRLPLRPYSYFNVIAVDFEAEAELHGLDRALMVGDFARLAERTGAIPLLFNSAYSPSGNARVPSRTHLSARQNCSDDPGHVYPC